MPSHHESFTPLTKQAVADVLGISVRSAENWINDGTLPVPVKLGNRVYWHPDVFFGWLSRRLLEPGAEEEPEIKAQQFVLVESPATEASALANVKAKPGFEKLAGATLTSEVVETIYMPKFRLMTKGEPGFAGIGAIFGAINLRFAREELKKANRFNQTEAGIKFDNAVGGLVAGVKLSESLAKVGRFLAIVGRFGGAIVGLVSAAIDAYHAYDELEHGNILMFALYTTSALIGGALVVAAFLGSVLMLPLLLLAALIGVLINFFKSREVDDWLEQCYLGIKATSERFERLEEDRKAFAAILS